MKAPVGGILASGFDATSVGLTPSDPLLVDAALEGTGEADLPGLTSRLTGQRVPALDRPPAPQSLAPTWGRRTCGLHQRCDQPPGSCRSTVSKGSR